MTITTDNEACHQGILADPTDVTYRRAYADLMLEDSDPESQEIGEAMHWSLDRPDLYLKIQVVANHKSKLINEYGIWKRTNKVLSLVGGDSPTGAMRSFVSALMHGSFVREPKATSITHVYIRNGWPEEIAIGVNSPVSEMVRGAPIQTIKRLDKKPLKTSHQWLWVANVDGGCLDLTLSNFSKAQIDADICGFIQDGEPIPGIDVPCLAYPTKEAAEDALSDALIRYFRTTGKASECR